MNPAERRSDNCWCCGGPWEPRTEIWLPTIRDGYMNQWLALCGPCECMAFNVMTRILNPAQARRLYDALVSGAVETTDLGMKRDSQIKAMYAALYPVKTKETEDS